MTLDKEIIGRIVIFIFMIYFMVKIFIPIVFDYIKNKINPKSENHHDIDRLIKSHQERLKVQYGINSNSKISNLSSNNVSKKNSETLNELDRELRWGGGRFTSDIQNDLTRKFYINIDSKAISLLIKDIEKKGFFSLLLSINEELSNASLKSFLTTYLIYLHLLREIKSKDNIQSTKVLEQIAPKIGLPPIILLYSFQLKFLYEFYTQKKINEEKIYSENFVLNQYPDEMLIKALDSIANKEGNIWMQSDKNIKESLAPFLFYAEILSPINVKINNKNIKTSYEILGLNEKASNEEVKKAYKLLALKFHPDKLTQYHLPPSLIKKTQERFGIIKKAYENIIHKK